MKRLLFFFLMPLFLSVPALALLKVPTSETYESGRILCQQKYANLLVRENGFYVTVPADYAHSQNGTTDVYAFFQGSYDPNRETLVYFTGGPGIPSHWGVFPEELKMGFNVLIMEHRGVACSRPPTLEQYLDPQFYSSEFVARDAERMRQHLKIERWTVYGLSYGTVPATIYASLFPESTRALILEGTVESGEKDLWEAPHRRKLVQKMLDRLPADIRQRIDQVSTLFKQPDTWMSMISRDLLTSDNGLNNLQTKLLAIATKKTIKT